MFDEWKNRFFGIDERFVLHRYASTRLATIVGLVLMFIWFNYDYFVNDIMRLDFLVIMVVMAVVKVGAMVYYSRTH